MTNKLKRIAAHFIACSLRKTTERSPRREARFARLARAGGNDTGSPHGGSRPEQLAASLPHGTTRMHIQRGQASLPEAVLVARGALANSGDAPVSPRIWQKTNCMCCQEQLTALASYATPWALLALPAAGRRGADSRRPRARCSSSFAHNSRDAKNLVEHRLGQNAGKGVLLAGVITSQQPMAAGQADFCGMAKLGADPECQPRRRASTTIARQAIWPKASITFTWQEIDCPLRATRCS